MDNEIDGRHNAGGLYIQLFSIHGLVRGANWEMGRNADTGGQVKYVVELARALGEHESVRKVDLFTRLILGKNYDEEYAEPVEELSDKVRIVRVQAGGRRYIRKELLWPHVDEFVENTLRFTQDEDDRPDVVHGHYADGGYVAMKLAERLNVPLVFTGHSLGIPKRDKLAQSGMSAEKMNKDFQIEQRIDVENEVVRRASFIVTSTEQEVEEQYAPYKHSGETRFIVIPPGLDNTRFYPFYADGPDDPAQQENIREANFYMNRELERFLSVPDKPLVLALSRPDRRKNIPGLVTAYGQDKQLQMMANLAVFAGIRRDINAMDDNEREVLTELLLLMDKFDLYGKLAIPKRHDFEYEVPELYRIAARTRGVFVNPAYTEPFGLTLIESAASGLPIVATDDGGPRNIINNCQNGLLVDVHETDQISSAIRQVLSDEWQWRTYSQSGVQGVNEHYSWEAHSQHYLEALDELRRLDVPGVSHPSEEQIAITDARARVEQRFADAERVFISDIDHTLLGDDAATAALAKRLREANEHVAWGVATGRPLRTVTPIFKKHGLPQPDVIISSVGTEIYYGRERRNDIEWAAYIGEGWDHEEVKAAMKELDFVEMQMDDGEREFKLSYYMDPHVVDGEDQHLRRVHEALQARGLRYTLIHSRDRFLDVLPERASKGKAIEHLCRRWHIDPSCVVVAGDSDNDADMLSGETNAVVVGNHHPELNKLRDVEGVYFAEGEFAWGILEGLEEYGAL